jgi:hypothetical protein
MCARVEDARELRADFVRSQAGGVQCLGII